MADPNRPPVFSEQMSRPEVRDAVHGANVGQHVQIDDDEKIVDIVVKDGVLLQSSCLHCGRQWKGLVEWVELANFYVGQPVQNTMPTRQGVLWQSPCRCGKAGKVLLDWADVEKWVDDGIRRRALKPNIKQVRPST